MSGTCLTARPLEELLIIEGVRVPTALFTAPSQGVSITLGHFERVSGIVLFDHRIALDYKPLWHRLSKLTIFIYFQFSAQIHF